MSRHEKTPEKMALQLEYNRLRGEYFKRFGEPFGYVMFSMPSTIEEMIAEVKECLRTGEPQKPVRRWTGKEGVYV